MRGDFQETSFTYADITSTFFHRDAKFMVRTDGPSLRPRLSLLVPNDDAKRECAYGPARGLPDTKIGRLTQALYDQACPRRPWLDT